MGRGSVGRHRRSVGAGAGDAALPHPAGVLLLLHRLVPARGVRLSRAGLVPLWWRRPEAVIRLEAVWRSFEALRQAPATGISVWLRDHADVHMAQLTSPA